FFFFQAEDGIRDGHVTGVQTCALPIFVSEYVDETYARSVKALHGHLLDQAIEFVARMSLASVVFRKTHFFEQLLLVPSRDLVKRAPVLLAAQTIEQLQALGPLVLQGGIEFGCRR